ncbi:MAG: hypothetical protein KC561_21800, partial [Myxococcales bacterium]|nr:hypothetical protein [Myxococcales bacterium]
MSREPETIKELLNELTRTVAWQAELGMSGVPRAAFGSSVQEQQRGAPTPADRPATPPQVAAKPRTTERATSPPDRPASAPRQAPSSRVAAVPSAPPTRPEAVPTKTREPVSTPSQARVERPVAGSSAAAESLAAIQTDLGDCKRCRLCEGRQNIVFGVG